MACQGDECLEISDITATSAKLTHYSRDAGDPSPYAYTVYASDGTTVIATGTTSTVTPDLSRSYDIVTGLTPNTTYIAKLDQKPSTAETFTTLPDSPKVATESMWADLASKIKAMEARVTALEGN